MKLTEGFFTKIGQKLLGPVPTTADKSTKTLTDIVPKKPEMIVIKKFVTVNNNNQENPNG